MGQEQPGKSSEAEQGKHDDASNISQAPTSTPHETDAPNYATRRSKRFWLWGGLGLCVLLGAYFWWSHRSSNAAPASSSTGPATIHVSYASTGNMNIYVDALGTVTPLNTVTIYSQISGRVMNVLYREGQSVHKGEPLIEIDPRPSEAALAQALGTLKHDQGLLAEAKIDYARYQTAFAHNAIARQQVEDQEQTVVQYEGTVEADRATVEADRVQLSYCHITAPMSGRVGLRLVDPGNTIFSGSSTPLVVITGLQPITVVFNVSEDDLPQVQTRLRGGQALKVDAFDRSSDNQLDSGVLTSLNNQIDTTTGTVKFRASFPNRSDQLYPNQFVNARLLVRTLQNAILVPSGAIQHNGTTAFVYVVNPGSGNTKTVSVHPVTVVTNDATNSAIQGLASGVAVATSGFDRIENGSQVVVSGAPAGGVQQSTTAAGSKAP